jgi:glutathione synthase
MKILVIADPVEKLRPLGDSTLAIVREALRRKHEIFWAHHDDLEYRGDHLAVHTWDVVACKKDALAELGQRRTDRLTAFGAVLIRKDPPFDSVYVKLCWLLALCEKKTWMMNAPSALLRYHEKLVPLEAVAQGFLRSDDVIPTHMGASEEAREFVAASGYPKVVAKPFLGYAGNGVTLQSREEFIADSADHGDRLVQPFREEIYNRGDRRVIYLGGRCIAHFARMPKAGSFISNLAQGGTAAALPVTPRESESIERLGKFLSAAGIHFAGADLIGHWVSEVNITSPTGLRSLEKLEGTDYTPQIMDYVESNARARKR